MSYSDIINSISLNLKSVVKTKNGRIKRKNCVILGLIVFTCVQWCINSSLDSQCDKHISAHHTFKQGAIHVYMQQQQRINDLEFQAQMCETCVAFK